MSVKTKLFKGSKGTPAYYPRHDNDGWTIIRLPSFIVYDKLSA